MEEPTTGIIRTVLGDIKPEELGYVDYHEHLFQVTPLLPGEELESEEKSQVEADLLVSAGISAIIDATPTGLGRNPAAVARISQATGLKIVHTTGAHHGGHYPQGHHLRALTVEELALVFVEDVMKGFRDGADGRGEKVPSAAGEPICAGVVKAGVRYWQIGDFETKVLHAAAICHGETGVSVMVHLDYGSASHEVLDLLESLGVSPHRVILAHVDRNLDPGLHSELASRGAYLGYDGAARHREAPDSAIIETLYAVVQDGHADRLLLGGDVARASRYIAYGGMPGLQYLPLRFIPRLHKEVGPDVMEMILRTNPARSLAFNSELLQTERKS
ncbi:phosphotriesterase family protein [Arthrobacter psychrochitiniphilus]|uniref:phosphotriesterase family protein n=1 Tax=Arthrobacter psychrochitiniphilus TaxID=291045 RepID=UPI003F7B5998